MARRAERSQNDPGKERAMTSSLSPWKLGAAMLLLALYGCGSGDSIPTPPPPAPVTYSISGTILSAGGSLVLQDNGGDDLTVNNVGTFTFPTKLPSGATYSVSVKSSPSLPLQNCSAESLTSIDPA